MIRGQGANMVSQNVHQLITAAKALSAVERDELLRTLNEEAKRANTAEPAKSARQLWAEEMAKKRSSRDRSSRSHARSA
jgi:hypothetical protein